MVMKKYIKSLFLFLKQNLIRILIIASIIMISIGLSAGLAAVSGQLLDSYQVAFSDNKFPDIIIKNKTDDASNVGMSLSDKQVIDQLDFVEDSSLLLEIDQANYSKRLMVIDFKQTVGKMTLLPGSRLPTSKYEVVVEASSMYLKHYEIGDKITYQNPDLAFFGLDHIEVEIVGFMNNPTLGFKGKIPNLIDFEETTDINDVTSMIDTVLYFDNAFLEIPFYTDLYVKLNHNLSYFSDDYLNYVNNRANDIHSKFHNETFVYLTFDHMMVPKVIKENMHKMDVISFVFPVFFVIVVVIVCATSMTRMVEDDRQIAGIYMSLGFSPFKIRLRYYFTGLVSSLLGIILGLLLGQYILSNLIINAFNAILVLPPIKISFHNEFGLLISLFILISVLVTIHLVSSSIMKEKPAMLLKFKAPKPGSKVFLEYLPFLWKRLQFKYKSSLRNILRYPLHFIMAVLATMGSTALLFAGLGLYQNTSLINDDTVATIELISYIIILASAGLSILVTYNLTNMNIEERKREIATLKVLGYHKFEVAGYIFREVFLIALIGILIGLPLGYILVDILFKYINFGSIENIAWYTWLITLFISIMFILITDLLLYYKIQKIDMNGSLKTLD